MIELTDERLKELEKEEIDKADKYIPSRFSLPKVEGHIYISSLFSDEWANDEHKKLVFEKVSEVFSPFCKIENHIITINGYIEYDYEKIINLLKVIDDYTYGDLMFRDLGHPVQHEIYFTKLPNDIKLDNLNQWRYNESLVIFGESKLVF